jgi:hypothetical protein
MVLAEVLQERIPQLFLAAHSMQLCDRTGSSKRIGWCRHPGWGRHITITRREFLLTRGKISNSFSECTLPYLLRSGSTTKSVPLRLAVRVVIKPFELSKHATMKAALQFLHEAGIVVHGTWFANADVALLLRQQDAPKAAVALAEAGFKAVVQTSRQSG